MSNLEDSSRYIQSEADGSLTIDSVLPEDSAEFICRVYNGIGPADHLYINLVVESKYRWGCLLLSSDLVV